WTRAALRCMQRGDGGAARIPDRHHTSVALRRHGARRAVDETETPDHSPPSREPAC
ncbi:zinc carboxypeptidase superfamily protein, partial [Toxoplasma gondii TgCatPRC2]